MTILCDHKYLFLYGQLYCPEGRMSADRFIDLCRDTRLLGKTFTSENASAAFVSGRYAITL